MLRYWNFSAQSGNQVALAAGRPGALLRAAGRHLATRSAGVGGGWAVALCNLFARARGERRRCRAVFSRGGSKVPNSGGTLARARARKRQKKQRGSVGAALG